MKKYKAKVETPGKLVVFKNRKIRSPFILDLNHSDLKLFKMVMRSSNIKDFILEEVTNKGESVWEKVILKEDRTVVEELFDEPKEEVEPKTLLEKLLKDNRTEKE